MLNIVIKPIEVTQINEFEWTGGKTHLEYFKKALEKTKDDEILFLGAWLEGNAVGRCGIDFVINPGKATLWMFNVAKDIQGQGIGSKLMDQAEQEILVRGIDEIVLNVEKVNVRAQALYERRGYIAMGDGIESWEEDGPNGSTVTYNADVVRMSKKLN